MLYVVSGERKIKKDEVVGPLSPEVSGQNDSRSSSIISIASLARAVNHTDILKYLPDVLFTPALRESTKGKRSRLNAKKIAHKLLISTGDFPETLQKGGYINSIRGKSSKVKMKRWNNPAKKKSRFVT